MKKVFLKAEALKAASACSDADVGELEALISQATKAVDKAVGKGVLHKNTGARASPHVQVQAGAQARQGAPHRVNGRALHSFRSLRNGRGDEARDDQRFLDD